MSSHGISSGGGYKIEIGDLVTISGDISDSENVVYVSDKMRELINNGITYRVSDVKEGDKPTSICVIHVENWWWSNKNIFKVEENEKEEQLFEYDINELLDN